MRLILVFCFLCLSAVAYGQISISGKVVRSATNAPIPDASVYINGTSIGTTTDANGVFTIKTNYNGRIDLVISHTAYQKKVMTLTAGPIPVNLSIQLEPKTNVLDEIVIVNDPLRGWRKWHNLFTDYFIGTSGFAKKCTIKNPEVLAFHYNRADNELKVTSRRTLIVENRALGYSYKIDLNLFTYSFSTLELKSDITVFFDKIKPANATEEKLFAENRSIAFRGSKMDFIRALYNKDYNRKGFAVVAIHARSNAQKQRVVRMISDAIAQAYRENRNVNTVTLASIANGVKDTVEFYDQKLGEPDYVIKDTSSVFLNDSLRISADHKGLLRLKDTLLIQYSEGGGAKNQAFHLPSGGDQFKLENIQSSRRKNNSHHFQYTWMTLRPANEITIYPDGGYDGDLFSKGYMDDAKVAGLLPWDYQDTQPATRNNDIGREEMAFSQAVVPGDKAVKNILDQLKAFLTGHPTEKVYLQTDRPWYAAGDTIYFKAYVTAGEQHELSPLSKILHVDLIDGNDRIDRSIKLQLNNGMAWGDFALPDSIQNGNYKIRAYTRLMENDAAPAYFERNMPVVAVRNIRVPGHGTGQRTTHKIDLQFFPEGGELVTGIKSKVAFKAVGDNGLGVDVKGVITDNNGSKICDFASQHLGMGYFYLEPGANKTYKAELIYGNNTKDSFAVPKPLENGLVFSVNNDVAGKCTMTVRVNKAFYNENRDKDFSIIVYSGGQAMPFIFRLNEASVATDLDTHSLHSGIAAASLFSSSGEPLAERLFFVKNNDILDLKVSSGKAAYAKREKVKIDLHAQNKGLPVDGHFSVSVIDGSQMPDSEFNERTILTDLLLTSDLKGYVEQPNYYFAPGAPDAHNALDILMLTQGYRRFQWKSVLAGGPQPPQSFQPETSLEVAGTLTTPGGKPVPNGKVIFMDGKSGTLIDTLTDASGNFSFTGLNITDTTTVIISAHKGNNDPGVKLAIKQDPIPPIEITDTSRFRLPQHYAALTPQQYQLLQSRKQGIVTLKTVQISGRATPKPARVQHSANMNGAGHADYVIMGDQLNNCTDLPCLFGKLPGTISKNGKLYLTRTGDRLGQNKGYPPPPIKFILDGIPVPDQSYIFGIISVHDIYSIELLKSGGLLALYGSSAAGGAILFTTKRGGETRNSPNAVSPGLVKFQFNGFYKARQFYSPQYQHPQDTKQQDIRPTIYWNPEMATGKDGNLSFEYCNSDGRGPYKVIVEGIDSHGNIGRQVYRYKIE